MTLQRPKVAEEEKDCQALCSHGPWCCVLLHIAGFGWKCWSVQRDGLQHGGDSSWGFSQWMSGGQGCREGPYVLHVFSWSPSDFVLHVSKTQKRPSGVLKGKIMGTEGGRIVPALLYLWGGFFCSPLIWGTDVEGWAIMNSARFCYEHSLMIAFMYRIFFFFHF